MVGLYELVDYADTLLEAASFQDYAPNGLQIEGCAKVEKLVSGVTASLAVAEAAVDTGADALLVHHGYFWKGESPCITGVKRRRLRQLLENGISLLAYHLPLDAHPVYGNNARLADILELTVKGRFGDPGGASIAMYGELPEEMDAGRLCALIAQRLGRKPLHVSGGMGPIRTIGWCSGAAQGYIEYAAALGLDAYLSGEVSEQTTHLARETGVHFFAAGHHATERYGVQALAGHLAERFGVVHEYIEIDNPV